MVPDAINPTIMKIEMDIKTCDAWVSSKFKKIGNQNGMEKRMSFNLFHLKKSFDWEDGVIVNYHPLKGVAWPVDWSAKSIQRLLFWNEPFLLDLILTLCPMFSLLPFDVEFHGIRGDSPNRLIEISITPEGLSPEKIRHFRGESPSDLERWISFEVLR